MSKILAIALKDALIRFSSRSQLIFFIVLPLVFTFALGGGFGGDEVDLRPRLIVVDQDQTHWSETLVTSLEAQSVQIEVKPLSEAEAEFEVGSVSALLIIPPGFEANLLNEQPTPLDFRQTPNNNDALATEQLVLVKVNQLSRIFEVAWQSVHHAEERAPFPDQASHQAYFETSLNQAQTAFNQNPQRVAFTQPANTLSNVNGFDVTAHQSTGQLITWVLIPLLGTSVFLLNERREGTLQRLLTTPTTKATFLLGTITGQLALALIQMLILIGFGSLVLGVNWGRSPVGLAVMMVTFGLASVSLGIFLTSVAKSVEQANSLNILLGMGLALLGGCWVPIEVFPESVRVAVRILPTTWAMQGLSDLTLRGLDTPDILLEASVLLGFAIIFFSVGVYRFRFE